MVPLDFLGLIMEIQVLFLGGPNDGQAHWVTCIQGTEQVPKVWIVEELKSFKVLSSLIRRILFGKEPKIYNYRLEWIHYTPTKSEAVYLYNIERSDAITYLRRLRESNSSCR
jgi:hypothetical protein